MSGGMNNFRKCKLIEINDGVCKELYYIKFIMNGGGYTMFC